ncbi:MAG TPA: Ku protein [Noviherbaspirillum sp.]|uniref:Ku protein n=1 Tax=Noviherbaspirillum sp. TaxID=1926288 RepID=UPI002B462A3B|nr:Ku protein [Noviherbaspirillum sp.]HJV86041.1 Ku protein [Noviherbaspirillum sp.]
MTLPDQDVCTIHTKPTHAVDILAFVEAQEIPSLYFETPYYLTPAPGGEKLYTMLRETLRDTGKVGIAYVIIQARQHLAALMPQGESLVLKTLRWASEPAALQVDQRLVEVDAEPGGAAFTPSVCGIEIPSEEEVPGAQDDEDALLEEASAWLSSMLAVGRGAAIEVEDIDGWLEGDAADDISLAFFIPGNPHKAAPRAAGRPAGSRRRPSAHPARIRTRRTLH